MSESKQSRKRRKFPLESFRGCLSFAEDLNKFGAGNKVRRLSLFDHLNRSPDSGTSQKLITNCGKYDLTKGSYAAEFLELTPKGKLAVSETTPLTQRKKIQIELAITDHDIYNNLYSTYSGNKLPSSQVMIDYVMEQLEDCDIKEATTVVSVFLQNAEFLELSQTISGAQRLLTIDHALESLPQTSASDAQEQTSDLIHLNTDSGIDIYDNIEDICFYITPIGEDASEERKHADMFLESIIKPALNSFEMKVVRADKIAKPGTITKQIIENILKAKLVIADLSYHNPNVFYELALRHASRLPTVQIIRKADKIPFDLSNYRTIQIDTSDIYSLVPKLDYYRTEIAAQVSEVLKDPDSADNPLINVFPNLKLKI